MPDNKNILVCIPLNEEMEYAYHYMIEAGAKCGSVYDPSIPFFSFTHRLKNRKEAVINFSVIGDQGNLSASARLMSPFSIIRPKICFLVGIAGALQGSVAPDPNLKLGDVLISAKIKAYYADKIKKIDHNKEVFVAASEMTIERRNELGGRILIDSRKKFLSESFFRFRRNAIIFTDSLYHIDAYMKYIEHAPLSLGSVNSSRVPSLKVSQFNQNARVYAGTILGSEMVIDSEEFVQFLRDRNAILEMDYYHQKSPEVAVIRQKWFNSSIEIVDMESLGYLTFAHNVPTQMRPEQVFSVRGISDFSFNKLDLEDSSEKMVRRIAVENAIAVCVDMIDNMLS